MRKRALVSIALCLAHASCASGSGAPPPLAYAVPGDPDVTYLVGDTVSIGLEALGQGAEIAARSAATYSLHFAATSAGVRVTATVEDLDAEVAMPMAAALAMDEAALEGDFEFVLDRRGRAIEMSSPTANQLGGQVFAAPVIAHTLFPRLPGTAVAVGDSWADSVTYAETADAGETRVRSSLTYEVVAETEDGARRLFDITFSGSGEVTQDLNLEGARITQASQVEISGRVLWDAQSGLVYESETTMEGPGTVRVALLPAALPTRVRWHSRVRMQGR